MADLCKYCSSLRIDRPLDRPPVCQRIKDMEECAYYTDFQVCPYYVDIDPQKSKKPKSLFETLETDSVIDEFVEKKRKEEEDRKNFELNLKSNLLSEEELDRELGRIFVGRGGRTTRAEESEGRTTIAEQEQAENGWTDEPRTTTYNSSG